jgi:hypothetical protein
MMNEKGKYIRFDWAVRRILRDKANFGVLEGFLTVLIGEKITIKEIIESEGNQEDAEDKFNRVDIMAINSKGELIIVEIQNSREAYYLERILYGVAKAITDHMEVGDSYSVVKKVYSISILYFNIGRGSDYLYHGQNKFIGINTGDTLQVDAREKSALVPCNPKDIFPEYFLIRVNEFNKVATTPLEEWIEYLKTGQIADNTSAPGLTEAKQKLKCLEMSPAERRAYNRHIENVMIEKDIMRAAKEEGREEGRIEGREEGKDEERLRIARNLRSFGLDDAAIAATTGLTLEELKDI